MYSPSEVRTSTILFDKRRSTLTVRSSRYGAATEHSCRERETVERAPIDDTTASCWLVSMEGGLAPTSRNTGLGPVRPLEYHRPFAVALGNTRGSLFVCDIFRNRASTPCECRCHRRRTDVRPRSPRSRWFRQRRRRASSPP